MHKTPDGVYYPDTLVGTHSPHHHDQWHWRGRLGRGRYPGRAAMLGQPVYMLTPNVVGLLNLTGGLMANYERSVQIPGKKSDEVYQILLRHRAPHE